MMKNILFIITTIFTLIITNIQTSAQEPDWLWAKSAGLFGDDRSYSISTDGSGNVYITGYFDSDSIIFGNTTLYNDGNYYDIFVAKYDANGNVIWAKNPLGEYDDRGNSISSDASGNVYVTGFFQSNSITFDGITLTNANDNYRNIFIVKYDTNGNALWAKSAGGMWDEGTGVCTDASGNVYLTGRFTSSAITFGGTTLTNNTGNDDIFLVKYDANGNVLWAKKAGGTADDIPYSISTDVVGNVYLTGSFYSSSLTFGNTTLTNIDDNDVFVVKYDENGNVIWAKSAGGTDDDEGRGISIDAGGNVYIVGHFSNSSITFGNTTLTNIDLDDVFVVKYDSNGNVLWAKSAGGETYDYGYSIVSDVNGSIYITGAFRSTSITFENSTLNNVYPSERDLFIVKYDTNGNVLWAISAGGTDIDQGNGLCIDATGSVYLTGHFYSSSLTLGSTTLTTTGNLDIFVAKLSTTVSIEENRFSEIFKTYPNPFNSQMLLQTDKVLKDATLKLYNSLGQEVRQVNNINGQTVTLHRDNLSSGLYYLQLTQDNQTIATDKLVITD